MLRDSESVGCGFRALPAASRIRRSRDDQRRLCVLAGAARLGRRRRHQSRSEPGLHRQHYGRGRSSRQRGLHVRLWTGAAGRGRQRGTVRRDRRCRPVDRGLHGRFFVTPLRPADRDRARPRGTTDDRSIRRRRAADRASRVLPRRPSRPVARVSATSAGVRRGRSGRALRPGSAEPRRDQGARSSQLRRTR